jgi:hypothetical protein
MNAEMAQLVAMLEDGGPDRGLHRRRGPRGVPLTEHGVRVGHMLAMVEGEDADNVLEALLTESGG